MALTAGLRFLLSVCVVTTNITAVPAQPWTAHGRLMAAGDNPHYLKYADGTPFFWLGDTGWEMLHRLNRDEITFYIKDRREKGFNVIQAVLVSEFIHSDKAENFYGDSIFVSENTEMPAITPGNDPANGYAYDYWDHVDFAVKTAEENGIYLGLVPTWGEWVIPRTDKALFNTEKQAYAYGWFLGNRYAPMPHIIWILGGDRHPDERNGGVDLWRAMAEGITDGVNHEKLMNGRADYSTTLMTHHSFNSSSNWFHNDDWIDFHMWGSYHAEIDNRRSYEIAASDWNLQSPKPTINGEPCYEGHGINYAVDDNGYFTSTDVRLAAYWSAFSGCAGYTYGAQPVWQFTDENRPRHSQKTLVDWKQGLDYPGANQMKYFHSLMETALSQQLLPDQSIITDGQGDCGSRSVAIRSDSKIMIYIPTGNSLTVRTDVLSFQSCKGYWFNPRNGEISGTEIFSNTGTRQFNVPGMSKELNWLRTGRGCDWVLIIEGIKDN